MPVIATLLFSASAAAQSNSSEIKTSMSQGDIRKFVESLGYTVINDLSDGVGVVAQDENGLRFGVRGQACNDSQICKGMQFYLAFEGAGSVGYADQVNDRYAAIKAKTLDNGGLLLSRYVIMDYGQTLDNLALNLTSALAIARLVFEDITRPTQTH